MSELNSDNIECLERSLLAYRRIEKILTRLDASFFPTLSSRVKLSEFSHKLVSRAENIIFVYQGTDVAYIAIYANDVIHNKAYIPVLGVLPKYQGKGIGRKLLDSAVRLARQKGMQSVALEVDKRNHKAIRFYQNAGFVHHDSVFQEIPSTSILMEKMTGD